MRPLSSLASIRVGHHHAIKTEIIKSGFRSGTTSTRNELKC
jgi:hypothetical protein